MLEKTILNSVKKYLQELQAQGIEVEAAVVFGSQCTGEAHEWSDIDLLVIASQFDTMNDRSDISLLWRVAAAVDSRIEPIPCGVQQWRNDQSSTIIEIARKQGEFLAA